MVTYLFNVLQINFTYFHSLNVAISFSIGLLISITYIACYLECPRFLFNLSLNNLDF